MELVCAWSIKRRGGGQAQLNTVENAPPQVGEVRLINDLKCVVTQVTESPDRPPDFRVAAQENDPTGFLTPDPSEHAGPH